MFRSSRSVSPCALVSPSHDRVSVERNAVCCMNCLLVHVQVRNGLRRGTRFLAAPRQHSLRTANYKTSEAHLVRARVSHSCIRSCHHRVSASAIPRHPHSYACLRTRCTRLFSLPLNLFLFRSKSDLTLEELSGNSFFSGVTLKDETSAVKFEPDCKKCRTSLLPARVLPPSHSCQAFEAGS